MTEFNILGQYLTGKLSAIHTALNNKLSKNGTALNAGKVENKSAQQLIDDAATSLRAGVDVAGDDLNKLYTLIQGLGNIEMSDVSGLIDALALKRDKADGQLFAVTAQETGNLGNNSYEWAFGHSMVNRDDSGLVTIKPGKIIGLAIACDQAGNGNTVVEVMQNKSSIGANVSLPSNTGKGFNLFTTPFDFAAGDLINLRTVTAGGAVDGTATLYMINN